MILHSGLATRVLVSLAHPCIPTVLALLTLDLVQQRTPARRRLEAKVWCNSRQRFIVDGWVGVDKDIWLGLLDISVPSLPMPLHLAVAPYLKRVPRLGQAKGHRGCVVVKEERASWMDWRRPTSSAGAQTSKV